METLVNTPFHSLPNVEGTRFAGSVGNIEAALVEGMLLWWRSPGDGRWPFASDGPWHLMSRDAMRGDYDARGGDGEAPPPRPLPLTRDEVAARDRVGAWLALIPVERDRALVVAVVRQLAAGHKRPSWVRLVQAFPKPVRDKDGSIRMLTRGADGLRMRYRAVLQALAKRVRVGSVV